MENLAIEQLKSGRVTIRLMGQTPLYFNAMSAKAMRDLTVGGGKKTAAEKKEIKHDPEQEYRNSVYTLETGPTLLGFPAPAVKGAMATAALETKSVTKASVKRLIFLPEQRIKIWGKPFLKMDIVRSADINRTPDVRTRAYLPNWCAEVTIAFVMPTLSINDVANLLSNAGQIVGIGDFRQEKGAGSFGTFTIADANTPSAEWDALMSEGREVQEAALADPVGYDADSRELLAFVRQERMRRAG